MSLSKNNKSSASWQTQIAKARFSHLLKKTREDGDQLISYRGEVIAVLVSKQRYDALIKPQGSLVNFFKTSPYPEVKLETKRSRDFPREIDL